MATQKLIADRFGWSLAEQAQANADGAWAEGFEGAISRTLCVT